MVTNNKLNGQKTTSTREVAESFLARMRALHASEKSIKAAEEAAKELIEDEERNPGEQRQIG